VAVEADARIQFGAADLLGVEVGGVRTARGVVDPGRPGAGTLRLSIEADVGYVEVTR